MNLESNEHGIPPRLVFDPKPDLTACELVKALGLQLSYPDSQSTREALGEAIRHFREDHNGP